MKWLFSGRDAELDDVLQCIPKGWHPLVTQLIEDLFSAGWDGNLMQVKEKFGGLRFYVGEADMEQQSLIHEAENTSYKICEVTGQPGELRSDLRWIRTLCDEEYKKIKESD